MSAMVKRLMRVGNTVGVWVYRRSNGRLGGTAKGGSRVLVLTVRGRKSGREFSCPVAYFERSGGYVVVGSAAGLPDDPQWFRNLRAADSAVVQLGDRRHDVSVRILEGAERDEAFAQVLAENPGFADYETKSGRTMPLALLTPR